MPESADLRLQDEALTRYIGAVRSRVLSAYRLTYAVRPEEPRALLVVDRAQMDNRWFFAPQIRLPARLAAAAAEPLILPSTTVGVIRFAAPHHRERVAGREVLDRYPPAAGAEEAACRRLEHAFETAPAEARAQIRASLRGEVEAEGIDREYAFNRAAAIDGYHADLASLQIPFGSLFPQAAHAPRPTAGEPHPLVARVVGGLYALQGRVLETADARAYSRVSGA